MEIRIRKLSIDEYGYDPPHTQVLSQTKDFPLDKKNILMKVIG
jgi:hypothetical protein